MTMFGNVVNAPRVSCHRSTPLEHILECCSSLTLILRDMLLGLWKIFLITWNVETRKSLTRLQILVLKCITRISAFQIDQYLMDRWVFVLSHQTEFGFSLYLSHAAERNGKSIIPLTAVHFPSLINRYVILQPDGCK